MRNHLDVLSFKLREVKASDGEEGVFTGKASVYGVVDTYGDVVMPGAFTKTLSESAGRVVLLNQHDPAQPLGLAELRDEDDALYVTGRINLEKQIGRELLSDLRMGVLNGLSIGYETIKEAWDREIRRLLELRLWEVSVVTFPANQFARVGSVKQVARAAQRLAADLKTGTAIDLDQALEAAKATVEALAQVLAQSQAGAGDPPADPGTPSGAADSNEPTLRHSLEDLIAAMKL